jgi:hypothetical protein
MADEFCLNFGKRVTARAFLVVSGALFLLGDVTRTDIFANPRAKILHSGVMKISNRFFIRLTWMMRGSLGALVTFLFI